MSLPTDQRATAALELASSERREYHGVNDCALRSPTEYMAGMSRPAAMVLNRVNETFFQCTYMNSSRAPEGSFLMSIRTRVMRTLDHTESMSSDFSVFSPLYSAVRTTSECVHFNPSPNELTSCSSCGYSFD